MDDVFDDLLVKNSEPYMENGKILKKAVQMPVIVETVKSKKWQGYKDEDLQEREMIMEVSGYSEMNDIDWGYVK